VKLAWWCEALLVRAALAVLRALGPVAASNLGGFIARSVGPLLPVSRVAVANLAAALPELDSAARRRVMRGVWDNLGRTAGEFPHIAALRMDTPSGPGFEVAGQDVLRALKARGGPAIFFSAHFGNWEVLPPVVARFGVGFASMYRAAANPLVDQMIIKLRAAAMDGQVKLFAKGASGARAAVGHLAKGGYLGMLVDQKLNDGIEARLFGLRAMTAPALAAFALRYDCPVIGGYVERVGPARFRLVAEAPLALPRSGDRQADIAVLTQMVNDRIEAWVRARPEMWLWLHRRWPKDVVRI
jgi:KDO2-lipid IV(A) lauroyltransferase